MTDFSEHGPVHYDRASLLFRRTGKCEVCPPVNTYVDHCHEHDWIRGELCASHNTRLQFIDADICPHKWEPWMLEYWRRCPDCTKNGTRELPATPSEEEEAFMKDMLRELKLMGLLR